MKDLLVALHVWTHLRLEIVNVQIMVSYLASQMTGERKTWVLFLWVIFDSIYLSLNLLQSFQHVLDRSQNVANQVLLKDFVQQRSFGRTVQFFAAITQHLLKHLYFHKQLMTLTVLLHFQLLVSQTKQASNKENQVIELFKKFSFGYSSR